MLEKLNSIVYNKEASTVVKCITDRSETLAEKSCLSMLSSDEARKLGYRVGVPKLYDEASTEYSVCMEYIPGIRAYELVALLNQIIRLDPDKAVARQAFILKHEIIGAALSSVTSFQNEKVQLAVRAGQGEALAPYDFQGKLLEAVEYLELCFDMDGGAVVREEVEHIAESLRKGAEVAFRDATLKNFLLKFPESQEDDQNHYRDVAEVVGAVARPTNWQWTDLTVARTFLEHFAGSHGWVEGFYGIDFESAHALTNRLDDYLHVFTLEVAGVSYELATRFLADQLGADEEEVNYTILLRCLRDGTRRLFYKFERPSVYATRYYHETPCHLLLVALDALERLRQNSNKPRFLEHIHMLLSRCRTSYLPWPWGISVPPLEWITTNERGEENGSD